MSAGLRSTRFWLLLIVVAAAAPTSSHGALRRSCVPSSATRTLRTSAVTRLFTARTPQNAQLLYACRPHHRAVRLGYADPAYGDATSYSDEVFLDDIAIDGPYVAFETDTATGSGAASQSYRLTVRDIRTGQALTTRATGQRATGAIPGQGVGPTTEIALRHDGAVAWIAADTTSHTNPDNVPAYEIWAGKGQSITQVARITDGSTPTDLNLRPSSVSWTDAGQRTSERPPSLR